MKVCVHLVPQWVPSEVLQGKSVIVVDVLRATTTIIAAFEAGASSIYPHVEADEARRFADSLSPRPLLGGERGGRLIAGFDLANSPADYTSERVQGKEIVYTTSNGTRAMDTARLAQHLFLGAFTNRTAVGQAVIDFEEVHVVCAGTDGYVTEEDALLAGALVDDWERAVNGFDADDAARLCQAAWRLIGDDEPSADSLHQILRRSRGGRNLLAIDCGDDIHYAARLNISDVVPAWRPEKLRIERR
ncbi:MAG TPA: 2-phosphosulfolactate phosphatase [Pirellulaceae bacterium]